MGLAGAGAGAILGTPGLMVTVEAQLPVGLGVVPTAVLAAAGAPAGPATAGAVSALVEVMSVDPARLFLGGLLRAGIDGATAGLATKE